jgi:hypothetical protein
MSLQDDATSPAIGLTLSLPGNTGPKPNLCKASAASCFPETALPLTVMKSIRDAARRSKISMRFMVAKVTVRSGENAVEP